MNKKSGNCCWRQTMNTLRVGRSRSARLAAIATVAALMLVVTTTSTSGAPGPIAFLSGASVGVPGQNEALWAPLRQSTSNAADLETPQDSDTTLEANSLAAMLAVVNRQGIQGAENLQRVSAIAVPNLTTKPQLVVDARAMRAAEADAAAVAATEVALSVQATVEAQAVQADSTAVALAAVQAAEAEAATSATAAAEASAIARATTSEIAAAMSATREARADAAATATATAKARALAAAAVVSEPRFPDPKSSLLIALMPLLGGLLGFRLWQIKKEPFVLKAAPASAHARASASS
jgi:hypothetical protein